MFGGGGLKKPRPRLGCSAIEEDEEEEDDDDEEEEEGDRKVNKSINCKVFLSFMKSIFTEAP
jgi:hypothetical protein